MTTPQSPYGFTIFLGSSTLSTQAPTDLNTLVGSGNGGWCRPQVDPSRVFPSSSSGTWDFTQYDDAIGQINAAGLNCWLSLGNAYPSWLLNGFSNSGTTLPGTSDMSTIATTLANRYNGSTIANSYAPGTYLHIEAFDANEVFDLTGNPTACRDWTQNGYPAIHAAMYPIFKAALPHIIVANAAQLNRTPSQVTANVNALYAGAAGMIDCWNFHFYVGSNQDTPWRAGTPGNLSFNTYWQTIQTACTANGDTGRAIACTETGFATNTNFGRNPNSVVTAQVQAQYLVDEAKNAMLSGVMRYFFIYTIDKGTDGMSITQSGVPVQPTYNTLEAFFPTFPQWPTPANLRQGKFNL